MIPRNPDIPVRHTDEKSGIIYLFRYLTDEDLDRFLDITKSVDGMDKIEDPTQKRSLFKKYHSDIVNLFLVGWENCEEAFPIDGNPARYFVGSNLRKISDVIDSYIPRLVGIEDEYAKK